MCGCLLKREWDICTHKFVAFQSVMLLWQPIVMKMITICWAGNNWACLRCIADNTNYFEKFPKTSSLLTLDFASFLTLLNLKSCVTKLISKAVKNKKKECFRQMMWAVTLVEEKIINYITIIILHLCSCQSQQSVESKECYGLSELLNFEDIYLLRIIVPTIINILGSKRNQN